jgi:hypothetical protein
LDGFCRVGGKHDSEPIMIKVFESVGQRRTFSMIRLMASVPPLETPEVSK